MIPFLVPYYSSLQFAHGLWRWAVLAAAMASIVSAIRGLAGVPVGRKAGVLYIGALDLQILLGLLLYFTSPLVSSAWLNISAAMKAQELRFFAVEHPTAMLIAAVLAHIGSVRARKAPGARSRHARLLLWHALSLGAILIGIPWWRPLWRLATAP